MISPAEYYPEFDSAEVEETIAPLARFDDEITAVLEAGRSEDTPGARVSDAGTRAAVQEWLSRPEEYPFQHVVRSVAAAVADADPIDAFPHLFAEPAAALVELLERAEVRLREVYTRPLVAAVNHARESGLLDGETPEARYRYFVQQSVRTSFEAASGLSFPVLRDVTRLVLGNEQAAFAELCTRLTADRPAIADRFGIGTSDPLVSLGRSEGDTHNHGRSVSVLTFGSGKRLVYKPRDVSCEAAYVTIAQELNALLDTGLVAAGVLERDRYGYVEFVEAEDVSDMSAEFMRASGELAAVLYLLNARDMHFENILPTRRGPLPIDLETILHPERIHTGPTPEAPGNAYATIAQSIYGIGILPLVMAGKGDDAGHIDLGFLGDQGRGNSPFKSMQFDAPFTDRVSLALRPAAAAERKTVVGALTEDATHDLGRQMAEGFTRVFRAVMADPDTWTGLLRKTAAGIRVRYVHNPTALYGQTLRMTAGPGALDGTAPYLALLKRIAIASKTSDRQIIRSEMRQLAERDVPYFTVAGTGTALTDGEGNEVGADFGVSPLDLALAKAARMNEFELGEELRLLYSAFASRFPDNHLAPAGGTAADPAAGPAAQEEDDALIRLVARLSDQLVATSRPDRFAHLPRTWIGPLASAEANRPWPPGVLGYDLYTGRSGPALALAAAGRLLDERRYRDLSAQIFSTTADILSTKRYETRSIQQAGYGGYTGMAGILFALSAAGRILGEEGWTRAAQDALPLLLGQIGDVPRDRLPLDVIGGVAGVLSCVTAIGGPHAAESVETLTELLVDALHRGGNGARSVLTQSGFAHGVSGVLHALCRAHPHLPSGRRAVVESATAGLAERLHGFHDADAGNWSSNAATPQSFSTGWCHGSTGIALALSAYHAVCGDDAVAQLRDRAVGNIIELGFGRNLTWCHGDLGNHDALTALAGAGETPLRAEITGIERKWLQPDVFLRKLGDARSRYAHTSSLMVGTAGVVLHLVNRLDPARRVSPVLLTGEGR
ncbi:type 2 lanthipeptide synthetase LanM family protein [Streptomyces peucetius]|uniref:Type 2 lanthipeptide synthetase LanM family protein n=1 Tax=Streptomyces peucetius TaxID=1950 RepID=A0ABY6ICM3_STRPE|nr:type 2 lanthipeptide synthetase LanM family protein [Streptomyces peucetius]UYQ63475.1 type 2 lanthipeptide synthetase LanM family protein [Streptomyces peucetius]